MSGVNYYQLLGIHSTATDGEIRRAYRTLVLKYHPDKRTPDAVADELYRSIQEAYETLSCPQKRCLYDFVGSFVALADFPFSCPMPMPGPAATSLRGCGAVAADVGGGLWSRSSSGDTLHSWGTSSLASASRLSPSLSSDTVLSSSPGSSMTGLSTSAPAGHRPQGPAAASPDLATATSGGGGGLLAPGGAQHPSAAATSAVTEAAVPPGYPDPHAPGHQPHPQLRQQQQQQPVRPPGCPPEIRIPNPAEPGAIAAAAAAAAAGDGGGGSPVTLSPGTLLGKRRTPGSDDTQPWHQQQHHPHPQSPQSCPHPPPDAVVAATATATAGGSGSFPNSPTAAATAAAAAGRRAGSADVHHRLLLTLEEMYSGCVKQLRLVRRVHRPGGELASSPPGATLQTADSLSPHHPPHHHQEQQLLAAAAAAAACSSESDPGALGLGQGQGVSCLRVEELFRVVVQPGWREGTKVTFPGKGDELPCGSCGDMVLVVAQAAHCRYERRGNDLHTVVVVPLVEALTGGDTAITTLDGRRLVLPLGPACVQPFTQCVVKGEGMPIPPGKGRGAAGARGGAAGAPQAAQAGSSSSSGAATARGDLHVKLEVLFPDDLTTEQKAELRQALQG